MDLSSRSEYLAAEKRDTTIITSLFHDFRDILSHLGPDFNSYDAEINLASGLLYDGINIINKQDSIGQELSSITPINLDKTRIEYISFIKSRLAKRAIERSRRKLRYKSNQQQSNRQELISNNDYPQQPPSQQQQQQQQPSDLSYGVLHPTSYKMHLRSSVLQQTLTSTTTTPNQNGTNSYQQQQQQLSTFPNQLLEQQIQLELRTKDILQHSKPKLPTPIQASVYDKLSLSLLTHIPTYIISKTMYNEPQHIPRTSPWYEKLYLFIKNALLVYIPQTLRHIIEFVLPLDWIAFCAIGTYFSTLNQLIGLRYVRTKNSPYKNKKMLLEDAAFRFLGMIMQIRFLYSSVKIGYWFCTQIMKLSQWLQVKLLLFNILIKKFILNILTSINLYTPSKQSITITTFNDNNNNQIKTSSTTTTTPIIYPTFQSQLSPHERHKIRKRLFYYLFQVTNIKTGNHYKDDDIFQYYNPNQINTPSLSAYDLNISSTTEGAWNTTADDENSDNDDKQLLKQNQQQDDYIDPFGTSSDDDVDINNGDNNSNKSTTTQDDMLNVEKYIINGRKNKMLYLHLIEPNTMISKDNNDNNNNNNNDEVDDEDDGILFLQNDPNSGYQPNSTPKTTTPTQNNQNDMIDNDEDDESDIEINSTTPNSTTTSSTTSSPLQSKPISLIKASCGVCLGRAKSTTATTCGHTFCWNCILGYVQLKNECPSCRTSCAPSELLRLFQFG